MNDEPKVSYYLPRHEFETYAAATEVALKLKAANSDSSIAKFISIIAVVVAMAGIFVAVYHH